MASEEQIQAMIEKIKKIKPDALSFHILTPYPGSEIREYLKSHNLLDVTLDNLADYYKYDTNIHVNHHTYEMTAEEINRYYRLLFFRFKNSYWYFIKFGFKSLTKISGWKKLFKRTKMAVEYFTGWSKISF